MIQTTAFVLGSQPQGEADRLYVLFTETLGKIEAFAKSVRKPKARLTGHLEPLNRSWVMLIESSRANGESGWQIAQALEEENYYLVRQDPDSLRSALRGARLLGEFLPPGMSEPAIWDCWKQFLEELRGEGNQNFLFSQFVSRVLQELGLFPDPADSNEFSPRARGVLTVILKGIWLPQSSEAEAIQRFAEEAMIGAKKLMI